jgi:hypothetical protein
MIDWKRISTFIIVLTLLLVIGYDVVCAFMMTVPHSTISGVIWDQSHAHPVIPFAAGILMGHLFWNEA